MLCQEKGIVLMKFGQGMLYVEIEQHINDDGTEIDMNDDKMSLLIPGHLQNREAEFKEDAPEAMVCLHRASMEQGRRTSPFHPVSAAASARPLPERRAAAAAAAALWIIASVDPLVDSPISPGSWRGGRLARNGPSRRPLTLRPAAAS